MASLINNDKNIIKNKISASRKVFWFCGKNEKIFINFVFFNENNFLKIFLVLKYQKKGKKTYKF
jgi:hypothetical protein